MHQLFLDANTYLGFYSLTPVDIKELRKLVDLIKFQKVRLLIPSQVMDEVRRNRAKVVAERLKLLKDARLQVTIPQMAEKTPAAEALKKAAADAHREHSRLLSQLNAEAQVRALPADKLIEQLFSQGDKLNEPRAIHAAQQRKALGNPPGKGSSIGDGVNWETLLIHGAKHEPLHLVSADPDFASVLDPSTLDDYLASEWAAAKFSEVEFYRDIKTFLDRVFPDIRLASDVRKYFLIDALVGSESFASSHLTVAELNQYDSFSIEEANRLLSGGLQNTQVRWLARDEDVGSLLRKVIDPHRSALPTKLVQQWDYVLGGRGFAYGPVPSDADLVAPVDEEIVLDHAPATLN